MENSSEKASFITSIDASNVRSSISNETKRSPLNNESLKSVNQFESSFQKHFMGPMFQKLEETVNKNKLALEEIEEQLRKEKHETQMAYLTSHIPEEIKGNGISSEGLLKLFDELVASSVKKNDGPDDYIRISENFDKLNEVTCLASNICSYLQALNVKYQKNTTLKMIANEIYENVNFWLSRLFRFFDSNLYFHQYNDFDGILNLCKFAIHVKYDDIDEKGYKLFENKEPVIYISSASKFAQIEYRKKICFELGLPLSCIQLVSVHTKMDSNFDRIDLHAFVLQIEQDKANNKCPHLVVANAGSYNAGQCDNIQQLERICTYYKIWLHLDGLYLSSLALYSVPNVIQPVNSGDSITLDLASWIGVPGLSYVTLFKNIENAKEFFQNRQNSWDCLNQTLPYWCILQAMGHEGVINRIRNSVDISKAVHDAITKKRPFLKLIELKDDPKDKPQTVSKRYTLSELIASAINMLTLVEINTCVVIFKCSEEYIKETLLKHNPAYDVGTEENPIIINEYTSTLTSWLCDLLNSIHKKIHLELITIHNQDTCIRYSPVEHANLLKTTNDDIQQFIKSFEDVMLILDTSIKCKAVFEDKINFYHNLKSINIPKWAGVGAVSYVPDHLINKKHLIHDNEQYKLEVNKLNTELVKSLQAIDGAFSLGQTVDGLLGVKFGMVNEIDALDKLAMQVQETGKTVEESKRFIEMMEETVRKGIEKAKEDLRIENEKKLSEEGVLRKIPIVGGLLNWWAPKHHNSIGRAFDLKSGKIEKTENIFKAQKQLIENNDGGENIQQEQNLNDNNEITTRLSNDDLSTINNETSSNTTNESSSNIEQEITNNEVNIALLNLPTQNPNQN